jgi:hypothetical protein
MEDGGGVGDELASTMRDQVKVTRRGKGLQRPWGLFERYNCPAGETLAFTYSTGHKTKALAIESSSQEELKRDYKLGVKQSRSPFRHKATSRFGRSFVTISGVSRVSINNLV